MFEINKRRLEDVGSDALQSMLDRRDWTDLPIHSAFAANKKAGIISDDDIDEGEMAQQGSTSVIEEVVQEVSEEEQNDIDVEAEILARWEMELEMMALQASGRSGLQSARVIEEEIEEVVQEEEVLEEEVVEEQDDIDMEAEMVARWEMELEMMALQSTGQMDMQGDESDIDSAESVSSDRYVQEGETEAEEEEGVVSEEGEGVGGEGEDSYTDLLSDVDRWLQEN